VAGSEEQPNLNHPQSGAKPKTFPVSAPEHQINNVAIRASRVFEQEFGAFRAMEKRVKKSITSWITKSEIGTL
jgi:hypothetical protein